MTTGLINERVDAFVSGVLVHGGPAARRNAVTNALRARHPGLLLRVSSHLAEAAKCLADPMVRLVVIIDDPHTDGTVAQHVATLITTVPHAVAVCTVLYDDTLPDVAQRIEQELSALSRL